MRQALSRVCHAISQLQPHAQTPAVRMVRRAACMPRSVQLIVIARDDDTTFGILHSRFHEIWSLRMGTRLGRGERSALHALPPPSRPSPSPKVSPPTSPPPAYADRPARHRHRPGRPQRLVQLRNRWLNPPEWIDWIDEPSPNYPQRPIPKRSAPLQQLKRRTLTNLYNQRPQWLADAHAELDATVAVAYNWDTAIYDNDALRNLLNLNLDRQA